MSNQLSIQASQQIAYSVMSIILDGYDDDIIDILAQEFWSVKTPSVEALPSGLFLGKGKFESNDIGPNFFVSWSRIYQYIKNSREVITEDVRVSLYQAALRIWNTVWSKVDEPVPNNMRDLLFWLWENADDRRRVGVINLDFAGEGTSKLADSEIDTLIQFLMKLSVLKFVDSCTVWLRDSVSIPAYYLEKLQSGVDERSIMA